MYKRDFEECDRVKTADADEQKTDGGLMPQSCDHPESELGALSSVGANARNLIPYNTHSTGLNPPQQNIK